MFLAMTSDGSLFWQFSEGNNNRYSMIEALLTLIKQLDTVKPKWRETHVLMHDNCPSFATHEV